MATAVRLQQGGLDINNASSLQNLNPIVMPDAVPLWPLAPGWYVILTLLLAAMVWGAWRLFRARRHNAYRRAAIRELAILSESAASQAHALNSLLKRTALSVFPRRQVAALTGAPWHRFLDATSSPTSGQRLFEGDLGDLLERVSYEGECPSPDEAARLADATRLWPEVAPQQMLTLAYPWLFLLLPLPW